MGTGYIKPFGDEKVKQPITQNIHRHYIIKCSVKNLWHLVGNGNTKNIKKKILLRWLWLLSRDKRVLLFFFRLLLLLLPSNDLFLLFWNFSFVFRCFDSLKLRCINPTSVSLAISWEVIEADICFLRVL